MKLYLCSVKLADSSNHVVPNKPVTIPEIAVLKRIHGDAAVTDVRPFFLEVEGKKGKPPERVRQVKMRDGRPLTDAEERERLVQKYQRSGDDGGVNIAQLFGALTPLPKTLREIGIDPDAAAVEMRRKAEALAASAAQLSEEDDAPPVEDDESDFFDEPQVAAA